MRWTLGLVGSVVVVVVNVSGAQVANAQCEYTSVRDTPSHWDGSQEPCNTPPYSCPGTQQCFNHTYCDPATTDPGYQAWAWCIAPYRSGYCATHPTECLSADSIQVYRDNYDCDGTYSATTDTGIVQCVGGPAPALTDPAQVYADGETTGTQCYGTCTETNPNPPEERCDGQDDDRSSIADPGCLDNEFGCAKRDEDENPYRFSSGRVETRPIVPFSAPAPRGVFFGYRLQYGSHLARDPAIRRSGETAPAVHSIREDTHFIGADWMDNFSDRLIVPADTSGNFDPTGNFEWFSINGTIHFAASTGSPYKSAGGQFTLTDRGHQTNANDPRYIIQTALPGPHQVWVFAERTTQVLVNEGPPPTYTPRPTGVLIGYGAPDDPTQLVASCWTGTCAAGGYMVYIDRLSDDRIDLVHDTIGRDLDFAYTPTLSQDGLETQMYRLDTVTYSHSGSSVDVATLQYTARSATNPLPTLLDTINIPAYGTYNRFLYLSYSDTDPCKDCSALLTQVIIPRTPYGSSVPPGSPATNGEEISEEHWYTMSNTRPLVYRTKGLDRDWGYVRSAGVTTQLDLHQPDPGGSTCAGGCSSSGHFDCWPYDGLCYRSTVIDYTTTDKLVTATVGSSNPGGGSEGHSYSAVGPYYGMPKSDTSVSGRQDTYGRSNDGTLFCMVLNDNNATALVDPANPGAGCDSPATPDHITVKELTSGNSTTKTLDSVLQTGGTTTTTDTRDSTGQTVSSAHAGWTKTIDGTLTQQTRTTTYGYDALGRLLSVNGPLNDSQAQDLTEYVYWDDTGSNRGQIRYVKSHVGTSSSNYVLTTEYANYDYFGVPHQVTGPSGTVATLTPTTRLDWQIQLTGPGMSPLTSEVHLNPNGTLRYAVDPDGACITMQYGGATTADATSMPTVIKWTSTSAGDCGVVPINTATGTVEVRTYTANEPERLFEVDRYQDNVLSYQVGGSSKPFVYTPDRQLQEVPSPYSSNNVLLTYTDGLLTGVRSPDFPNSDAWKTDMVLDVLGRPSSYSHALTSGSSQTETLTYQTWSHVFPTQITRGLNGAAASTTTFEYDDFGDILSVVSPDHGTVRFEYDVAGNPTKQRLGVGTGSVRTDVSTFDSLGRVTFIDHDTEHPVNCASAPANTQIADEERFYDSCPSADHPAGFTCDNTSGHLAISRMIQNCSTTKTVVKDGRWYSYDGLGRLKTVALASVDGTTIGTAVTLSNGYTGGRLTGVSPSIGFGTTYTFNAKGQITDLKAPNLSGNPLDPQQTVLSNITYQPFGPVSGYITGSAGLKLIAWTNLSYGLTELSWKAASYIFDQAYTYNGAGLMTYRNDTITQTNKRFYRYDNLMHLNCEAKGSSGVDPSASVCNTTSTRLVALLTYNDGSSSTQPPDDRKTAFLRNTGYTSPAVENYSYSGGSNKITQISRGSSNVVLSYDSLGRRTQEYLSSNQNGTRRTFAYLPNGLVGTVTGTYAGGGALNITLQYDAHARPIRVIDKITREYYWDDENRLEMLRITDKTVSPTKTITWSYHYLNSEVVAATREISQTTTIRARF